MSFFQSTAEEYIVDFCQRALPFLKRVEELHKGAKRKLLEDYITTVAKVFNSFYLSHCSLEYISLTVYSEISYSCVRTWRL